MLKHLHLVRSTEITPESLQAFASEVLKSMHIEALVHGNMRDSVSLICWRLETLPVLRSFPCLQDATSIVTLAEETLKPKPLSKEELLSPRSMIVPDGELVAESVVTCIVC